MDWTSSFRPGSRFGPPAIRDASVCLEEYSMSLRAGLTDARYCDLGDLELPYGNVSKSLDLIEDRVGELVKSDKIPLLLGGEHLVTLPAVKAVSCKHEELLVVSFDAHADLRDEYAGEKLSHATVMRRIAEIVGRDNVIQVGVRSATSEEVEFSPWLEKRWYDGNNVVGAIEQIGEVAKGRPVYLSVDIDVVDPAYAPGTGTPEPGGITSAQLINSIGALLGLNLVGLDVVEVSPPQDVSGITSILAAKLVREMLILFGRAN